MKKFFAITIISVLVNTGFAQIFPEGTNAIYKDSSIIVSWAVSAEIERGYINISDTSITYTEGNITSNKAFYGTPENALGIADGTFVSLGDGGNAVLQFEKPLINGSGPDLVIFENAFFTPPNQYDFAFAELAFVEVSTNGIDFERFPAISQQQYNTQTMSFQSSNINLFSNFAGIYPAFYGVPFDLDDIPGIKVDKNNIRFVKIIDAIGCINSEYASYDSQGNIVNDPWPTSFSSCGFDLDAVGVIHQTSNNIDNSYNSKLLVYPNPAKNVINVSLPLEYNLILCDITGKVLIAKSNINGINKIEINNLKPGNYFLTVYSNNLIKTIKILKVE